MKKVFVSLALAAVSLPMLAAAKNPAIQEQRQTLTAKAQNLKDERKQQIVARVQASVTRLNTAMTRHFANVLDQLDRVIARIISRTDKAEAKGAKVAAVRTAITAAQKAVADGRSAVKTQSAKTYTITVTSDTTARSEVGAVRQALHADLMATRKSVKTAYDAVHAAATALAKIPKVDGDKDSGTATTTKQ